MENRLPIGTDKLGYIFILFAVIFIIIDVIIFYGSFILRSTCPPTNQFWIDVFNAIICLYLIIAAIYLIYKAKKKFRKPISIILIIIFIVLPSILIFYWFFMLGRPCLGVDSTPMKRCYHEEVIWCQEWSRTGEFPQEGNWDEYAPGCKEIGIEKPTEERCNSVLGIPI